MILLSICRIIFTDFKPLLYCELEQETGVRLFWTTI